MPYQGIESLPIIGESEVASLLEWIPLIEVQRQAMIDFSAGNVAQPVRQIVPVPDRDAIIAAMPAIGQSMAVKIVTLYHANSGTNIPTHQGVILVFDKDNGSPLALIDGRLITEMRTAAGSAAAAQALASDTPDVVTVMGNGVQAKAHIEALAKVCSWQELRVWARNNDSGSKFAEECGAVFFDDAEAAVRDSDVIACTTASKDPIVMGNWIKKGAFVTAVGWNTTEGRELDDVAMSNTVIVESREAAWDQAGNVRGSQCDIYAEIGEIYSNNRAVTPGDTVIYDSVGMAIMDVAAAKLVYDRWLESK